MNPAKALLAAILVSTISLCPLVAYPQGAHTARLNGVVLDPNGKPAPGAVVTYQSGGGDTPHAVHTDAQGRFTIIKLRRDNYDLRASSQGLYSIWLKNVMIRTGQQKTITLRLASPSETSKVSAKSQKP